jgi:hypothetical protein
MKPIPPKTAAQRRKLSVTLDEMLLQQVDELATFLGGATDRASDRSPTCRAGRYSTTTVPSSSTPRGSTWPRP